MHGLLLATLALTTSPAFAPPPASPTPRWLTDLEEARQQARKTDRPLFVVFRCEH